MNRTSRSPRWSLLFALVVIVAGGFFFSKPQSTAAQTQTPPRTVFVHLFEWKWTDIANECETWLGPKGYAGVQVSPPQEHVQGSQWWTRYQPVSYQIQSRSGTRAEFINMVQRCNAVGVDIYVDAVINHMTGVGSGTGVAGSSYSAYNYPGNYQTQDFHHCGRNGTDDIANYGDRWEVQNCELVNLADLATESDYVRGKLAAYMNDLVSIGVKGFRIDAAKHMPAGDIGNIISRLNNAPYIYQEVIDQGGEPITASEYYGNGDVTEFKYSQEIGRMFKTNSLANMSQFGTAWGFMPSANAIVFTDNHDNQRGHGGAGNVLTYKDGSLYQLANIYELAWPYGYPQVMSSYDFGTNTDQGPPSVGPSASGNGCSNGWVCEHRWRGIANMVDFRNYTNSVFSTSNWWSNGNNQISFSRGSLGFVAINREGTSLSRTFQTGLPAGTYCDVIHGDFNKSTSTCSGSTITVDSAGNANITVNAMDAVAMYGGAKVTTSTPTPTPAPTGVNVTFNENATTVWGQNVYVIGNISALGSWNTANAILLSSASYPVWSKTISLPANTAVEYKYIKKDGSGNVIWESGANRTFTTPASGTVTRNDTWK